MQKYALKDFEFRINPATWHSADQLAQSGAVKGLGEVEKHFWTAFVEDEDDRYEVEVIITPHRIKAYTCECWGENRRLMCTHVVATLLKLRQYLDQRAENRQAASTAKTPKPLSRLTVSQVLETADSDALFECVRTYARQDRDFALSLKTWFAGGVNDAENPFSLILDSLLPKPGKTGTWREADLRRLRKTLDNLRAQLALAQTTDNRRLRYQIGAAILQKTLPLLAKSEARQQTSLTEYCVEAFETVRDLYQQPSLPPELSQAIWQLLSELGAQGQFPTELNRDALRFLGDVAASDPDKHRALQTMFDQTPFPAPAFLLQWFVYTLAKRNIPHTVQRVLEDYRHQPEHIKDTLVQLYYLNQGPAIFSAADAFLLEGIFNTTQKRDIEDILFLVAEKTGNNAYKTRYFQNKFIKTGLQEWYRQLKDLSGKKWPAARGKLLTALREKGDIVTIATLYSAEGMLEPLRGLLESEANLSLLQACETVLLPEHKPFVQNQYVEILSAHLREHFGRPASAFVREKLAPLLQKNQQDLVVDIMRTLIATFADRPALADEFVELFPKPKQQEVMRRFNPPVETPPLDTP